MVMSVRVHLFIAVNCPMGELADPSRLRRTRSGELSELNRQRLTGDDRVDKMRAYCFSSAAKSVLQK